jgi:DNA-binding transcriptional ArsR family regulator
MLASTETDGDMDESKQAELFKVLGVESRIRIIDLLKQKGPLGVNELSDALGITPSAVSQHLKVLRYAGLVRSERKGYWLPYEIDQAALDQCQELLVRVCTCGCKGTGQVRKAELEKAENKIGLLKKYERELKKELEEVRARIKEITPE